MSELDAAPSASAATVGEALFRPVRSGNAFEETVERLLQTIRLGVIGPGESLPSERDLAARLSVGRDTVRDAIRSLAEAGYLVSRRGRYGGTFVCDELPSLGAVVGRSGGEVAAAVVPTVAELEDALLIRQILDIGAVRAAAGRDMSAADRERLVSRMRETSQSGIADYRRLDSRLNLTIGELAGSPSLLPLLLESRSRINALLDEIPLLERNLLHSNEQHQRIVRAILSGNPADAEIAMAEHLEGSAALLRGFLG